MADALSSTRRALLAETTAYVPNSKWIKLLQDAGRDFTTKEKEKFDKKPTCRFPKKISYGQRLHPDLYALSELVYHTFEQDDRGGKWFPRLPSNKSDAVHKIGQWIAINRTRVARGDIHSHQSSADLTAMLNDDDYKDRSVLYYLPQREMLIHFFGLWGKKDKDDFKPTADDKLRLLGILLTDEEMRDFIADILTKRRSDDGWQSLDAATGRAAAAWVSIRQKFIDKEVVITLPEKWSDEAFHSRVNEKTGNENFFATHGTYNVNNYSRMELTWDKTALQAVLDSARTEYEEMMKTYTFGTGGGTGYPEDFAIWQDRDESWIMKYTPQQAAMLYLTIVFMWDKEHGFPLKPPEENMPDDAGREDEQFGGSESTRKSNAKSKKGDNEVIAAINKMSEVRQQSSKQLIDALNGMGDEGQFNGCNRSSRQHSLVQQISETRLLIREVKDDLKKYNNKRKECEEKYEHREKKKQKKLKVILSDLKRTQTMLNTLNKTLEQYTQDLQKINDEDDTNKELEYGSSSGDDSSSDDDSSSSDGDSE